MAGTESSPYQINSIEDLRAFSDNVAAGQILDTSYINLEQTLNFKSSKSYIDSSRTSLETTLIDGATVTHNYTTNIMSDLSSNTGFEPIAEFLGTFDGKNNELKNIYINYTEETSDHANSALFAINQGTIQNLSLTGTITGTMKSTYEQTGSGMIQLNTGAITGENYGIINNCTSKATITAIEAGGYGNALCTGGISGYNEGNITNCSNSGIVLSKSNNQTYLNTSCFTGGIVAAASGGGIENSYNNGSVKTTNCYCGSIAGIVSFNLGSSISKCYNTGSILAKNIVNFIEMGGIVGENYAKIENCYNLGTITTTGTANYLKGGIIGYEGIFETVKNNYDNTGIGAIGGQDFIGIAEQASLTETSVINYINTGDVPNSKNLSYAIDNKLKPGAYVKYDTTSLPDKTIDNSLSGVTVKTYNSSGTFANGARSAGSTHTSINTLTSKLSFKPTNYSGLTDMQFYKDFANMCYSGTATATSGGWYWLASRYCHCDSDWCYFYVRNAGGPGHWGYYSVYSISSAGEAYSVTSNIGVRPIVSLKSNLSVSGGSGTSDDPYTLAVN